MSEKARDSSEPPQRSRSQALAEWSTFGAALVILGVMIGLIVYQYFAGSNQPPVIEVIPKYEELRQAGGQYYLPVEIVNRGEQTAEDLQVEIVLVSNGEERESSDLTILFLAGGAEAYGTVVFDEDPTQGELQIDVISFLLNE